MSLVRIALSLALLSACGAQIADGVASGRATGDDDSGGTPVDSDPGNGAPPVDAPPTAATCSQRTLFLNFEGQALQRALVSDATKNQASWLQNATGTAPAYHKKDGDRATQITSITDGVRSQLSAFPVNVVTTRPASGNYVMIVLGGVADDVSSAYDAAVNTLDCGDLVTNDVAWISDDITPAQHVMNLVVGATGFGLGLTATNDPNDCMCGWANDCRSNDNTACTLGSPITRATNATQTCQAAGPTQDEARTIHDAFCGK